MVLSPGISLGVLSLQESHSATYNEHMPMNELHTIMQPTGPRKAPITDPHDMVQLQPIGFTSRLLWMLLLTKLGGEPLIFS